MSIDSKSQVLRELQVHFQRFDQDNNGYIDLSEFKEVLRCMGEDPPQAIVELNFSVIDGNEDGVVSFKEFSEWWLDQ